MSGQLHRRALRDARAHQVSHGRSSEVMQDTAKAPGVHAGRRPRLANEPIRARECEDGGRSVARTYDGPLRLEARRLWLTALLSHQDRPPRGSNVIAIDAERVLLRSRHPVSASSSLSWSFVKCLSGGHPDWRALLVARIFPICRSRLATGRRARYHSTTDKDRPLELSLSAVHDSRDPSRDCTCGKTCRERHTCVLHPLRACGPLKMARARVARCVCEAGRATFSSSRARNATSVGAPRRRRAGGGRRPRSLARLR